MQGEKLRYATVVVIGYGIDLLMSIFAIRNLSFSLPAASATGFLLAFLLNYVLHEFWTFRRDHSGLSLLRFVQSLGAALLALALRVGFLAALGSLVMTEYAQYAMLIAAAGFSFLVNYALLRLAVFR
ncbi:GtrA family protein [Aquamicrobium sp. LC103]|uniref:GtrA family protein n=1 Tax=Aquamicrobium sp. LC103 TaxID=1120658 RepID=UPI00063E847B|nr:GtrA family protein [Aquamicrobium sp. LC103]